MKSVPEAGLLYILQLSFLKQKNDPRPGDGVRLVECLRNVQLSLGVVLRPHKPSCGGVSL